MSGRDDCKALTQLERRTTSQMLLTKADSDCVEAMVLDVLVGEVFLLRGMIQEVCEKGFSKRTPVPAKSSTLRVTSVRS
jgi:hypothetical protein